MAAAQRLLDNAARIRSWVDLSGDPETRLCHLQHGPRILGPVHTVNKHIACLVCSCIELHVGCDTGPTCMPLPVGASIAIDDCYELWESGFISIPFNFKVQHSRNS